MKVEVDESAGFCWGVQRTIEIAEEEIAKHPDKKIYILGELIHNKREVQRLESLGLKSISLDDLPLVNPLDSRIILRAHGEPPETYDKLKKFDVKFTDTTCSIVAALQDIVAKYHSNGFNIIIYGKVGHPEVIGLLGNCGGKGKVIGSLEEAINFNDFAEMNLLIAQTTISKADFESVRKVLSNRIPGLESYFQDHFMLEIKDSTCKFVNKREAALVKFVESFEIVFFVAGRNSSNGKMLFELCRAVNPRVYYIEDANEIGPETLEGRKSAGITGATSTPRWLLLEVKERLLQMTEPREANIV